MERGRLELIGGVSSYVSNIKNINRWKSMKRRISYNEFKDKLQCASTEPDIDTKQGVLALTKLIPVTKGSIEVICAWVETHCDGWKKCNEKVAVLKNKTYKAEEEFFDNTIRLLRVISGKLHFDWPWGVSRFYHSPPDYYTTRLFSGILEIIDNVPNSVFFLKNHDTPLLPANFPIPSFSHSPTIMNSDIPYPWARALAYEILYHTEQLVKDNLIFYDSDPDDDEIWNDKETKAGWYGALWSTAGAVSRQVILDLQQFRPDYISAGWTTSWHARPYNPESREETAVGPVLNSTSLSKYYANRTADTDALYNKPGYLYSIASKKVDRVQFNEYIATYKYLIVVGGQNGVDRLATFFAHSGAVILLQESDIMQHFSARIKPWVHYVPISFTAADLIEKIEWLNTNPILARRIAKNGYNFGKSYLRLEDYYCYTAYAMHLISKTETKSSLEPFNSRDVHTLKTEDNNFPII